MAVHTQTHHNNVGIPYYIMILFQMVQDADPYTLLVRAKIIVLNDYTICHAGGVVGATIIVILIPILFATCLYVSVRKKISHQV